MISLIAAARQLSRNLRIKNSSQKYQAALQQEPEVVMAHSALMKLLRSKVKQLENMTEMPDAEDALSPLPGSTPSEMFPVLTSAEKGGAEGGNRLPFLL
jgi:hypothetical protein